MTCDRSVVFSVDSGSLHHTTGQWFSLWIPVPSTNKSADNYIGELLLKVALNINIIPIKY